MANWRLGTITLTDNPENASDTTQAAVGTAQLINDRPIEMHMGKNSETLTIRGWIIGTDIHKTTLKSLRELVENSAFQPIYMYWSEDPRYNGWYILESFSFKEEASVINAYTFNSSLKRVGLFDTHRLVIKAVEQERISHLVDMCDALTGWTESGEAVAPTLNTDTYKEGTSSIALGKSVGATTSANYEKTITSFDMTEYMKSSGIQAWLYIESLDNIDEVELRLGQDSSNYYSWTWTSKQLTHGWNRLYRHCADNYETAYPTTTGIVYLSIEITTLDVNGLTNVLINGIRLTDIRTDKLFDNRVRPIKMDYSNDKTALFFDDTAGSLPIENLDTIAAGEWVAHGDAQNVATSDVRMQGAKSVTWDKGAMSSTETGIKNDNKVGDINIGAFRDGYIGVCVRLLDVANIVSVELYLATGATYNTDCIRWNTADASQDISTLYDDWNVLKFKAWDPSTAADPAFDWTHINSAAIIIHYNAAGVTASPLNADFLFAEHWAGPTQGDYMIMAGFTGSDMPANVFSDTPLGIMHLCGGANATELYAGVRCRRFILKNHTMIMCFKHNSFGERANGASSEQILRMNVRSGSPSGFVDNVLGFSFDFKDNLIEAYNGTTYTSRYLIKRIAYSLIDDTYYYVRVEKKFYKTILSISTDGITWTEIMKLYSKQPYSDWGVFNLWAYDGHFSIRSVGCMRDSCQTFSYVANMGNVCLTDGIKNYLWTQWSEVSGDIGGASLSHDSCETADFVISPVLSEEDLT